MEVQPFLKKMFILDKEKIECSLGNKSSCFWQGKKEYCVLFLTSGLAEFICLWLLVLPNANN